MLKAQRFGRPSDTLRLLQRLLDDLPLVEVDQALERLGAVPGNGNRVCNVPLPFPISKLKSTQSVSISSPSERMAARSITFFNSLTLPGHRCWYNLCRAPAVNDWGPLSSLLSSWNRKCSTRSGMSSARPPQGRDMDRQDIDPVVQILPKKLLFDHLLQVLVGGLNDPAVHGNLRRPPKAAASSCPQ